MGRRIEGDITLYAAALRLMDDLPTGGLGRACELGIRLHAMMEAQGAATAGVDFVEIAGDLLDY